MSSTATTIPHVFCVKIPTVPVPRYMFVAAPAAALPHARVRAGMATTSHAPEGRGDGIPIPLSPFPSGCDLHQHGSAGSPLYCSTDRSVWQGALRALRGLVVWEGVQTRDTKLELLNRGGDLMS